MSAPELEVGRALDPQTTVTGVVSRGARVTAYEGVRAPARPVIVKVYDPALGAASLAALRSAAAVTRDLPRGYALEVLDVGVEPGRGAAFVVTERSARPSLAHLVQLCPLSPDEVVALVRSLARALGGAHERGLPHLGIKPTNVFVGAPPACEVQLADFGATLARAAAARPEVDPEEAPWLSPEQAFGGLAPGVGSDIFSTALVVFFALTGRSYWHAFATGGDPKAWVREIWAVHAPASVRAAELGATLPAAWDLPFARALDVDPARRPRSIAELADSFARAARGEPALDPPAIHLPRFEVPPIASDAAASLPPSSPVPSPLASSPRGPSLAPSSAPQVFDASAAPVPPSRPRRAAWIAIVVVVAGGLVIALVLLSRRAAPPAATTSTPPVASARVGPLALVSSTTPATSSSLVPAAPVSSLFTALPTVDPQMSTLLVTCNPTCDSIWVDGHPAPDASSGKPMPPGVHMVGANLARHPSKVQPVLLRRGQVTRVDVTF